MKHHSELLWPFYDFYVPFMALFLCGCCFVSRFWQEPTGKVLHTCPQKLLWDESAQRHMSRKCFYPTSKCQSLWTIFGVRFWSWETAWEFLDVLESWNVKLDFLKASFLWFLAILDKNSQWKNPSPCGQSLSWDGSRSWSFQFSLYKFVETIRKVSAGRFTQTPQRFVRNFLRTRE